MTWIPIEPQPDAKYVSKLHRYYATLKGNDSYKKRVTCVSGGGFDNLAVVEYNGVRSNTTMPHGNARTRHGHHTYGRIQTFWRKSVMRRRPSHLAKCIRKW